MIYRKPLDHWLYQFKYGGQLHFAHIFANIMIQHIEHYSFDIQQFDLICPVPLHWKRQWQRGFNQADEIAKIIAKKYHMPYQSDLVKRKRSTRFQAKMTHLRRSENIAKAFRLSLSHSNKMIKNKNILIIDDLLTTGSTLNAIGKELKQNGSATVGALTLAITTA